MKTSSLSSIRSTKSAFLLGLPALLGAVWLATPARAAGLPLPVIAANVDVNIDIGPPPEPRHEVIIEKDRPSREHVWVPGYWVYRHGHHEWIAGHWEKPPHGRTVWVEPRWERRGHSYVFIEGYWAEPHHEHDHH